ncbi:MAG TPA: trehalose-6-phosphate synthase, partial [Actinomycetota bacterium]|nr:trehalose-6-phosphate synthase [Actinomycetota bacterium]
MSEDLSVVLASNRGPFSFVRTDSGLKTKGAAGGASPALDAVAKRLGDRAFWVATAISDEDREAVASGQAQHLAAELGYGFRFLTFEPDTYTRYYNEVSNRMLWYANHCLWEEVGIGADDLDAAAFEDAYEPVNVAFATEVAEHVTHGALVLFQDYHLATAPGHLRKMRPDAVISHFTHSSFCGPFGMEVLPSAIATAVTEGMLGADLVGFHVAPWVEGFLRCCEGIGARVDRSEGVVDHDGRRTWVRAYPIPIDAGDLVARAHAPTATSWAERFRAWAGDATLVVRGDRAEPSKNIVRGFEAFGLLLDDRADLRGRVRFAACLYPSRQGLEEYRAYVERIHHAADAVNERHPGAIELYMNDDFERTLGAYRQYDVLLVNPIMDGMNLVSKEGPALNERDGVLVLSEGAGSFSELGGDAVAISDPFDLREGAAALARAIEMDQTERKSR